MNDKINDDNSKTISFTPVKQKKSDENEYLPYQDIPGENQKSTKRPRRSSPRKSTVIFWCISLAAIIAAGAMFYIYNESLGKLQTSEQEYEQAESQMKEQSEKNKEKEDTLAKLNEEIESLRSQLQ